MKLTELKPDTEIVFEITLGTEVHEFASQVTEVKNDFIIAEPVRIEGKVLGLSSASVPVSLVYKREEKAPIVWKQVAVSVVTYKKNTFYKVQQTMEGRELNRRGSYRLYVGVSGVAQLGNNRKAVEVTVKDISEGGFAFVCNEDLEDIDRGTVHLVFKDGDRNISINGIIVRKIAVDTGRFLYGCLINLKTPLIAHYINLKQRERMAQMREAKSHYNLSEKRSGTVKAEMAEAFTDKKESNIDIDRYRQDLLDENKRDREIDRERYKDVKF